MNNDQPKPQSSAVDVTKQVSQVQSPGARGLKDLITRLDRPVTMMGQNAQKQTNK